MAEVGFEEKVPNWSDEDMEERPGVSGQGA